LRVAYTEDEVDWLRYTLSVGRGWAFNDGDRRAGAHRELHPFYNLDGVKAALHTPHDGHVDPAGVTFALAAGARQRGARSSAAAAPRGITGRATAGSSRRSRAICARSIVVNAGGTYARQIGAWSGLDLPIDLDDCIIT
jgi:dimethylglycine dehydrogenase